MNFKKFYEWYHRDRKLPKRIIGPKNFTYRHIVNVLDEYCKSNDVLDIGSGVGTIDFYLGQKGKKVTGIEISERAFNIAQKSLKLFKLEKNVHFKRIDFLTSSFGEKYNFVICTEVLEHLPDDKRALAKIRKMLKRGGTFILTVPSKNAPLNNFGSIVPFDKRSGHLRRYTFETAKALLKEFGFRPIYGRKTEGVVRNSLYVYKWGNIFVRVANRLSWISDIITFLDNISLKLFGESQIIIVSKV